MLTKRMKGNAGEEMAVSYLKNKKYDIIFRNYHSVYGEIDIIAQKGEALVIIEVKLRKDNLSTAVSSISTAKKKKLIKTTLDFLSKHPEYENVTIRFDIIAVVKAYKGEEYRITHIKDSFRGDDVVWDW